MAGSVDRSAVLGFTFETLSHGSWSWNYFGFGDRAEDAFGDDAPVDAWEYALGGGVRIRAWKVEEAAEFVSFILDQCGDYLDDPYCSAMLFGGIQRRLEQLAAPAPAPEGGNE